jgi:hypothetical protein
VDLAEVRKDADSFPKPVWTEWIDSGHRAPALSPAGDPGELLLGVIDALGLARGVGVWFKELAVQVESDGPDRRFGIIAQRNMKDDSVGGAEYRVTMEREGRSWQIVGLEERQLCWRAISGDGKCL